MSSATTRPMIAILLALLVAGCSSGDEGLGAATAPGPGPGPRIVVPNVVGLNPAQARTRLCAAGLSVGPVRIVARTPEARGSPGEALVAAGVRATRPPAGETVAEGGSIALDMAVPRNTVVALKTTC